MRSRLYWLSASLLLLAGCRSATTLAVDVTFDTEDPAVQELLLTASQNVIERRAYALEEAIPTITPGERGQTMRLDVELQNEETVTALGELLKAPLDFFLMCEAEEGEEPDYTNETYGDFVHTGITQQDIEWVYAHDSTDGTAQVAITFTAEGQNLFMQVLDECAGKQIGVFVHGGLVSLYTLPAENTGTMENIMIDGVPSIDLANIFADDMNVGIHVTFAPLP